MGHDPIDLYLDETMLPGEVVFLKSGQYDEVDQDEVEAYGWGTYPGDLMISVESDTGRVVVIVVENFKEEMENIIKALREEPLPWLFNLPQLKVREKPLEDVLLAVWKKYKNVKTDRDED